MTEQMQIQSRRIATGRIMTIVAAIILIIGALLPWGTVSVGLFQRSLLGIQGDGGIISLGTGVALLIAGIARKGIPGKNYSIGIAIIGVLIGVWLVSKLGGLLSLAASDPSTSVGAGLWLSLIGPVLATLGGLWTVSE